MSVIILTYNNLQYLHGAIASVTSQNYRNIEIVISDDCSVGVSRENIIETIAEYQKENNIIVNVNKQNLGTVKNFNNAIKISSGEIIIPLSCDDKFVDTNVVSEIVMHFENTGCYVCTSLRKGEKTNMIMPEKRDVDILIRKDFSLLLDRLSVSNFISGSTLYYSREIFDKCGLFDEKYLLLEDYPYVFKLVKSKVEISFLNRVTIIYGQDGVSNSNGNKKPNSKLMNDINMFYCDEISKSVYLIKNTKCRRYVKYEIDKRRAVHGKVFIYVKYLDVTIEKLLNKISKRKECIFWRLYKQ